MKEFLGKTVMVTGADMVLFLAGQDYITGQNFVVDGGRTLGPSHR